MPQDTLPPTELVTGRRKCMLTEKANEAAMVKSNRLRPTDPSMMTFKDEVDNTFHCTTYCGTTPLDSANEHDTNINSANKHDTDVVYEIDSDDSNSNASDEPNVIPEQLAESEQAKLSMQISFHYSMLLTCYVQIAL